MKEVILEYAGAAIAAFGAIGFLVIFETFFIASNGVFAVIISAVLGGL